MQKDSFSQWLLELVIKDIFDVMHERLWWLRCYLRKRKWRKTLTTPCPDHCIGHAIRVILGMQLFFNKLIQTHDNKFYKNMTASLS